MYFFDQDDLTTITVGQILLRAADEISFPPKASKPRFNSPPISDEREARAQTPPKRRRPRPRSKTLTTIENEEDREERSSTTISSCAKSRRNHLWTEKAKEKY